MKYKLDTARMGMLIFLGVVLGALWLVAAYGFYRESERAKYDVEITPGAVSYGTHSTALMPVSVAPLRHTLPMLSGGEIRSYAHGGHANMPAPVTGKGQLHTTSSAKVKNIGSGAGNSSIYTTTGSSSHRAERGITYSNAGASLPVMAMLSTSSYTPPAGDTEVRASALFRRVKPSTPGYDGQTKDGGSGDWWYYDEGEGDWFQLIAGETTRFDPILGYVVVWNGTDWVKYEETEFLPIGPLPWMFMLLLALWYGWKKKGRVETNNRCSEIINNPDNK